MKWIHFLVNKGWWRAPNLKQSSVFCQFTSWGLTNTPKTSKRYPQKTAFPYQYFLSDKGLALSNLMASNMESIWCKNEVDLFLSIKVMSPSIKMWNLKNKEHWSPFKKTKGKTSVLQNAKKWSIQPS